MLNLIVTCFRHAEEDAILEMKRLTDNTVSMKQTNISGVLTGLTSKDPIKISQGIQDMVAEEPWSVRYVRRIIPIQSVVNTDIDSIMEGIQHVRHHITDDNTWRVSIKKRNTSLSSQKIISDIAGVIPNKVSLESPDIIIHVEILGGITGVAALRPGDVFSLDKTKRSLSEN